MVGPTLARKQLRVRVGGARIAGAEENMEGIGGMARGDGGPTDVTIWVGQRVVSAELSAGAGGGEI